MSDAFKVLGVEHVGLAPKDVEGLRSFFETALMLPPEGEELVPSQQTQTYFYPSGGAYTRLEILAPAEGKGPIAKFLASRGGGIHHIALEVDNLANALACLKAKGIQLIDEKARKGAHGSKVAFIHPHASGGILIELVEKKDRR
ncbi:MAG: methylmalonyl-CoA epimerase [Deltaproteobacteria bacterium]|nr:methylmalonyl-CoA epimerase [Deltaproteobacteria bacterium]